VLVQMERNMKVYNKCVENNMRRAFLVTGDSLALTLDNPKLCNDFIDITMNCDSVICCRVTPKQKAAVVKKIK